MKKLIHWDLRKSVNIIYLLFGFVLILPTNSFSQKENFKGKDKRQMHHEVLDDKYVPTSRENVKTSPAFRYSGKNIFTTQVNVNEDGENILIEYYSVDTVGNIEEVKSETLDIDKTPPDVGDIGWVAYKEGCTWYVDFTCNATDVTSGMDRVEFFINDGHHETITGSGPTYVYVFTIEWSESLRPHTAWFYHYDEAGNMIEDDLQFSVIESYVLSQGQQVNPVQHITHQ